MGNFLREFGVSGLCGLLFSTASALEERHGSGIVIQEVVLVPIRFTVHVEGICLERNMTQ